MILLADSGSTKTDWCVADGAAEICRIATHGTNPFFQSADEIAREVDGGLLPAAWKSSDRTNPLLRSRLRFPR